MVEKLCLMNILTYLKNHWIEFIKFLKHNHNQFNGVEISWNGIYGNYEIRRK